MQINKINSFNVKSHFIGLVVGFCFVQAAASAPLETAFTYQGQLEEMGVPANGAYDFQVELFDADFRGNSVAARQELQDVSVGDGAFALTLDFGLEPLSDQQLFLEIGVRPGGSSRAFTLLSPRTRLTAAPQSIYSLTAGIAETLALHNVITVSRSGGDFASVASAVASITDAAPENPYLVQVAAGEFFETDLVRVPSNVHLRGSGINATLVVSERSNNSQTSDAATLQLEPGSQVSQMRIENRSDSALAYGVFMGAGVTRDTLLEDVRVEANGPGGTGHHAVYLSDAEPTIRRTYLAASGASLVNGALGIVNGTGGFPRPLIQGSTLLGGGNNTDTEGGCFDPTGTGFGIQMSSAAPEVVDSRICGGHRGISASVAGLSRIFHSRLAASTTSGAFMVETTGSASVSLAYSQVFYLGNKYTGAGNGIRCFYSIDSAMRPLSDGDTTATACN